MTTATLERERTDDVSVTFRDVSGHRQMNVSAPADASVGELIRSVRSKMDLPENDSEGVPVTYRAHLDDPDGHGRQIPASGRVGEILKDQDEVVLQRDIDAG